MAKKTEKVAEKTKASRKQRTLCSECGEVVSGSRTQHLIKEHGLEIANPREMYKYFSRPPKPEKAK